MKRKLKAVVSVICAVTLLASLIIPSLVLPAAAYTFAEGQDTITYTFDGSDFKANTAVAGTTVSGGAFVLSGSGDLKAVGNAANRAIIFNNGEGLLELPAGDYVVEYKYRYSGYTTGSATEDYLVLINKANFNPKGEANNSTISASVKYNGTAVGHLFNFSTDKNNVTQTACVPFTVTSEYSTRHLGLRTYGLPVDVYIEQIIISKKTSIEVIPTDGVDTAETVRVSGTPGASATLPNASALDGAIAGKVFEGFYADAAFTTPITAAQTFPTDALSKTIYAKLVVDNAVPEGTLIFDFDNNNKDMKVGSSKIENITISGGAYGINTNKPAEAEGNVLSVNGNIGSNAHNHGDTRDIIFNDGTSFTALPAGDYEITYDYFVKYVAISDMSSSCGSCSGFFNGTKYQHIKFATFKKSGFGATSASNVRGALSDGMIAANVVSAENPTASGSGKVAITVTEDMVTAGTNYFGIRIATLSYAVWLDNIMIKPVKEEQDTDNSVTIDFEENIEAAATGLVNIIDEPENTSNKVLSVKGNNEAQNRSEGIKDKDGNEYTLTAGKWKVSYRYKIPTAYSPNTYVYIIHGFGVYKGELCNIDINWNYTSGRKLADVNLVTNSTVGTWQQGEFTFTLDADVTKLGFTAFGTTVVYLDDVVFTPVVETPVKTVTMDFENDTANHTGSSLLGIISTTGKDGQSTKVLSADSDNQIRTQLVKDKEGNTYSLTKGVWKMTYDYKVPTSHSQKLYLLYNVTITANPNVTPPSKYTSGVKLSETNLVKVNNMGDTWLSDSIVINVEEDVDYIGFGAECGGNASTAYPVYIDNVVFTEVTDSAVNVSFNTNGGNDIASVQGLIGETITVADPVKSGFDFVGWYEDASLTTPSDMKFKAGVSTLYAAWTEAGTGLVFDFDTKNRNFAAGGNWSGAVYTVQNDPKGESGKVLGLNAVTTNHNHGNARDILFNDGTNAITLEAGTYKIDYKYYAIYRENGFFGNQSATNTCTDGCNSFDAYYADPSQIKIRFGVLGTFSKTNPAAKAASTGTLFDMGLITPTYESRWTNGWAILTVTEAMVQAGNNKLVLCADKLPFTVYLDDIKINAIDTTPVTISFDSKGGSSVQSISTQSYTVVSYPTPTKAGYSFDGWVDSYGNPAPQYAPTVNTTYYATWSEIGKYAFIDMDNGFLSGNLSYGSGYFTKNTTKFKDDADHKNTLRFYNTNGSNLTRIHLLSSEGKFAQVSPGKIYKVTFDYYVEQLPDGNGTQFDFTVNHNDANSWLYNPTTAKRLTGGNILDGLTNKSTDLVGKWITKEIAVAVPTNITDSRLGILSVNGKGAIVHFDNIKFESIEGDTVLLTYVIPATGQSAYIIGDRGTRIDKSKIPVLNSTKLEFAGWYSDEEFKTPFNASVFPSKSMTIYGATQLNSKGVHINFEDYPWKGDTSSSKISLSVMDVVNDGISYDGDGWALKFDNTRDTQTTANKNLLLNLDGSTFPLQNGATYIFTYRYYITKEVTVGTVRVGFNSGNSASMWGNTAEITGTASVNAATLEPGKWYTGYATGTVDAAKASATFLQAYFGIPLDAVVYFDDITVQQVPDGYSSVVYTADYGIAPDPVVVKTGSTITLGKVKNLPSGKLFTGWIAKDENVGSGKYTVNESVNLTAGIVTETFTEGFENWNSEYAIDDHGFDGDWAIYDSKAQGNSADNVKSGRYSLHRKGEEPGIKGYSMFMNNDIAGNELVFGNYYTVSMWVKVKDPVHTLGAIAIRNNDSFRHAWGTSTDELALAAIADIADGEWHKVSGTFMALSRYISIFTPGNLEIFIDDVTVEYAPNGVQSSGAIYEKYVPVFLTEDGEYIPPEDGSSLNDFELVKRTDTVTEGGSHIVEFITQNLGATIAIIAGAVVLIAGVTVLIIILIKKRKAKEEK